MFHPLCVCKMKADSKRNLKINPYDIIGRAGGLARAKKLSAKRRKEIAVKAANTRWKKQNAK